MYDYTSALRRSDATRAKYRKPTEITLLDREWILLPEVFSPADSRSSLVLLEMLEFPVGGSFAEIGCGMGINAVQAALSGCASVLATDLNTAAVRNTELNARRHGVADKVRCVHSDLFDDVPEADGHDLIYWHSNNVWTPPELALDEFQLAWVDPGYQAHQRFFAQAPERIKPGGRVVLGLSTRAARADLGRIAAGEGRQLRELKSVTVDEPEGPVGYELLEVIA